MFNHGDTIYYICPFLGAKEKVIGTYVAYEKLPDKLKRDHKKLSHIVWALWGDRPDPTYVNSLISKVGLIKKVRNLPEWF